MHQIKHFFLLYQTVNKEVTGLSSHLPTFCKTNTQVMKKNKCLQEK